MCAIQFPGCSTISQPAHACKSRAEPLLIAHGALTVRRFPFQRFTTGSHETARELFAKSQSPFWSSSRIFRTPQRISSIFYNRLILRPGANTKHGAHLLSHFGSDRSISSFVLFRPGGWNFPSREMPFLSIKMHAQGCCATAGWRNALLRHPPDALASDQPVASGASLKFTQNWLAHFSFS